MSVYVDKRSGRFFVQFDYLKQTYKFYLPKGSTRTAANRFETNKRSELFFQSHKMAPLPEESFEDFLRDKYLPYVAANSKSFARVDQICLEALPFFRGKALRSIKASDIEAFKIYRQALKLPNGENRKPATLCRELSILSKLFSMAVNDDLCDYNPCSRIEKPSFDNTQVTILPYESEDKFFANFDKWKGQQSKDICTLVLNTGLRQNDVLGLTSFQVDGDVLRLVQGKTTRVVEIPLNDTALEIVQRYNKGGLLFKSSKTGRQLRSIRKAIASACTRAEIDPITIRDLRRTFATRLADKGVDALTIAMLLGHRDLRMVHRYARSNSAMRKAVELLGKSTPFLPAVKLVAVK